MIVRLMPASLCSESDRGYGVQVKQGERFETATDTEVIPKLCKYVYNNFTRSVTFSQVCPQSMVA